MRRTDARRGTQLHSNAWPGLGRGQVYGAGVRCGEQSRPNAWIGLAGSHVCGTGARRPDHRPGAPSATAPPGMCPCLIGSARVQLHAEARAAAALGRLPQTLRGARLRTRTRARPAAALALVATLWLAPDVVHADGDPSGSSGADSVPPSPLAQRAWAGDHIGSFTLSDGSVVFSTGRPQRDGVGFDPTMPQNAPQVPLAIMPYVNDNPWPRRR